MRPRMQLFVDETNFAIRYIDDRPPVTQFEAPAARRVAAGSRLRPAFNLMLEPQTFGFQPRLIACRLSDGQW